MAIHAAPLLQSLVFATQSLLFLAKKSSTRTAQGFLFVTAHKAQIHWLLVLTSLVAGFQVQEPKNRSSGSGGKETEKQTKEIGYLKSAVIVSRELELSM